MARTRPRRRWTDERLRRFGGVCIGARQRSVARPCERFLRMGANDVFRNARDALGAPRMHRSDAEDDVRNWVIRVNSAVWAIWKFICIPVVHSAQSVYRFAKTKRCQSKRFGKTKRLLGFQPFSGTPKSACLRRRTAACS